MIDWIDAWGRLWAHQIRRVYADDAPMPSLSGRLMELGPDGAAIKGSGRQHFPEVLTGDALAFHVAWRKLDGETDRKLIAVHYLEHAPVKKKAHWLTIPRSTYWHRLHLAHARLALIVSLGQGPIGQSGLSEGTYTA